MWQICFEPLGSSSEIDRYIKVNYNHSKVNNAIEFVFMTGNDPTNLLKALNPIKNTNNYGEMCSLYSCFQDDLEVFCCSVKKLSMSSLV